MKKLMVVLKDGNGNKEFFEGEEIWYSAEDKGLFVFRGKDYEYDSSERVAVFSPGTWSYVRELTD